MRAFGIRRSNDKTQASDKLGGLYSKKESLIIGLEIDSKSYFLRLSRVMTISCGGCDCDNKRLR